MDASSTRQKFLRKQTESPRCSERGKSANKGLMHRNRDIEKCSGLLDHLIGDGEQGRGNGKPKSLRGLEIDHEPELSRLLNG